MKNVINISARKARFVYEPEKYGVGHVWKTRPKLTTWEYNQNKARKDNNRNAIVYGRLR